ncbi:DUF6221 family protein [Arthrobacter sp. TMS1-12-1]
MNRTNSTDQTDRTGQADQANPVDDMGSDGTADPMDELAAFILARVTDDLEVLAGAGVMPVQVGERLLAECEVKRSLVGHVQSIDWAYEPAGDQDYMRTVLELLALPWAAHPAYNPDWAT